MLGFAINGLIGDCRQAPDGQHPMFVPTRNIGKANERNIQINASCIAIQIHAHAIFNEPTHFYSGHLAHIDEWIVGHGIDDTGVEAPEP